MLPEIFIVFVVLSLLTWIAAWAIKRYTKLFIIRKGSKIIGKIKKCAVCSKPISKYVCQCPKNN